LKIEKFNKKSKVTADKKRREKLFEEEDLMMVYLSRKKFHLKGFLLSSYIKIKDGFF